ncbi:MAG TPA: WS/DGAT domain-containing protein, partial [Myxococcales bacterium]|nr:WS/DGAT domain-containing protein [Myxococcales bacterium]
DPAPLPPEVGKRPEKPRGPLEWARDRLVRAGTFAQMLALPPDPPTLFRRPLGLVKRAAWSGAIPLLGLRGLARRQHATVNDVLMGTLAGVLRGALLEAGRPIPSREIRALVPVFLGARNGEMGNRFGLAFVDLPVGEPDAGERVRKLKQRMDAVKSSVVAPVAFDILRGFGLAGPAAERVGVEIFTRKATVMVTNVPGPKARIHLAGRKLASVMVWAPTSGRLGFSVTLLSYGGDLRLGVAADAHIEMDPQVLVERFEKELISGISAAD